MPLIAKPLCELGSDYVRYSRPTIAVALLCLLHTACATQSDSNTSEGVVAFVKVNVIPMDRQRVVTNQTVIVRSGRIQEIGSTPQVEVPGRAVVIDGGGKYLMPGLADMHVHLASGEEADPDALIVFLAAGVTTVRNMWGRPVHLGWRKQINDGDLLGPNIYSTGPITDGDPPFWPGSAVVTTPEEAVEAVVQQKQAGYDGMKVFTRLSPDVYEAILNAGKEQNFPIYGHIPIRVGLENALTGGQKSFEHMRGFVFELLPGNSPVRAQLAEMRLGRNERNWRGWFLEPYEHVDRTKIPMLAAKAAAAGVWFCPTLSTSWGFALDATDLERLRSDPRIAYVPPNELGEWERMARFLTTDDRNDPAIMKRGFETMLLSVKALHDAGARLVAGTDTPNPWVIPGFSIHDELAHLVDAGLTPYEALAAATRDAAEFMDALDEFGIVAEGRRADLILLEANPLEDTNNATKRVGVMVRGRWYSEADLQARLEALSEQYQALESEQKGMEASAEDEEKRE